MPVGILLIGMGHLQDSFISSRMPCYLESDGQPLGTETTGYGYGGGAGRAKCEGEKVLPKLIEIFYRLGGLCHGG